jgi:hypothetical protein
MAIDLHENLLTLSQVSDLLPGRPQYATVRRWTNDGVDGVRLEAVVVGGRTYISREAVDRFIAATTAKKNADRTSPAADTPQPAADRSQSEK